MVGLADHVMRAHTSGARILVSVLRRFLWHVLPMTQRHEEAMSWAQRDQRLRLDWMSRHQAEFICLGHHGQDHDYFQHRQVLTDTLPRPAAEGKVGEARAADGSCGRKPFRVELFRVLPEGRVALEHIGAQ
jgi:hypothetical protein